MDRLTAENAKKALDLIKQFVTETPQDGATEDLKTKKTNADRAIDYFDKLITLESGDTATKSAVAKSAEPTAEPTTDKDLCNDCLSFMSRSIVDA